MCWLEILGFVTALVLILKSVYNLSHFVYVNFLGRLLGHGLNISKCGPWAGNLNIAKKSKFIIMFIHFLKMTLSVVTGATDGIGKSYARLVFIYLIGYA